MTLTLAKIKERKIVQWALAYLAGAWLVLQVVDVLGGMYEWPPELFRAVPVVLAVGFIAALVLAWYHGERGAQKVSGVELGILASLLAIAGLGVMLVGGGNGAADSSLAAGSGSEEPQRVDRASVAVLPFDNLSQEDADGYFASGLTEELLATMARVPGLKVAARTSSFAFGDKDDSTKAIGEALGVAHLVEGSVRRAGEQVRVTARLINAESGSEIWTDTYERRLEDVFAVQEQIARAVARELRIRVGDTSLAATGSDNVDAYDAVLRGRAALERREGSSSEWVGTAERAFETAIELDEDYAAAWGGLAGVQFQKGYLGLVDDPDAAMDAAREAANRALTLDPTDGYALYALALIALHHEFDYREAVQRFEKAIEVNPSSARSLALIGWALVPLGEQARALRMAERAIELDPLSVTVLNNASAVFSMARRFERAKSLYERALELHPEDTVLLYNLATNLSMIGEDERAIEIIDRTVALAPEVDFYRQQRAWVYARAGRTEAAEAALEEMAEDAYALRGITAWELGKEDMAFEAWRQGVQKGDIPVGMLQTSPEFDPVRESPRWAELIEFARSVPGEN